MHQCNAYALFTYLLIYLLTYDWDDPLLASHCIDLPGPIVLEGDQNVAEKHMSMKAKRWSRRKTSAEQRPMTSMPRMAAGVLLEP